MSDTKILVADEGMYYTDGNTYGKTVILAPGADEKDWVQVTEAELPREEMLDLDLEVE